MAPKHKEMKKGVANLRRLGDGPLGLGFALACITLLHGRITPYFPWTRFVTISSPCPASQVILPLGEDHLSACEGLLARYPKSVDVHECLVDRRVPMVVNGFCRDASCSKFVQLASTYKGKRHNIAVVTVDTRRSHPGHAPWAHYAKAHNYTYIAKYVAPAPVKIPHHDMNMVPDWATSRTLLKILDDPNFTHIDLFMYTELDQWPVRPLALLEPVFEQTGLVSGDRAMLVVTEYPCENIRNGGRFNMGNFLFRRGEAIRGILRDLDGSKSYKDMKANATPYWPARQGAFTVDVYPRHSRSIATLKSGCPLGSPFGSLVGHMTSGNIDPFFYFPAGRHLLVTMLRQCVLKHLKTGDPRPCSVYPPWVQGKCTRCHGSLAVLRKPSRERVVLKYYTCCGEDDSTLAVEWLEKSADEILLEFPNTTSLNLGFLLLEPPKTSSL